MKIGFALKECIKLNRLLGGIHTSSVYETYESVRSSFIKCNNVPVQARTCARTYVPKSPTGNQASGYNYGDGSERTGSALQEICPWDAKTSQSSDESIRNTCTGTHAHK